MRVGIGSPRGDCWFKDKSKEKDKQQKAMRSSVERIYGKGHTSKVHGLEE